MRVGILRSGLMGGKLLTILAHAGHEMVFSYARKDVKLKRLARCGRKCTRPDAARGDGKRERGSLHCALALLFELGHGEEAEPRLLRERFEPQGHRGRAHSRRRLRALGTPGLYAMRAMRSPSLC
jgi:hypothetical protein